MSLEEYFRKRTFQKTPEPEPGTPNAAPGRRFCVQRHHARRLHYDFRLEVGGALKSWAVPQGPTLEPLAKRLAVMVEDHPIEYGDFEGNIPAGNYGAGSVMLWDRGAFELLGERSVEEQIERGDLKFRLEGVKLRGEFALVRMKGRGKGNEWLLIKKRDVEARSGWDPEGFAWSVLTGRTQEEVARDLGPREAIEPGGRGGKAPCTGAAQAGIPEMLTPMLATPAAAPPAEPGWLFEVKWDGVRALCFVKDGAVRLVSRNGNAMDRQYPELSVLPHHLAAGSAILDGEIVALDEEGRPSFSRLQPRIMATDANTVAHLARTRPVALYVFDLLYLDGWDLRQATLVERRRLLASVLKPGGTVRLSAHFEGKGAELLEAARVRGLEGIVAKRAASTYEPARSREWLKVKVAREQDFVICGYTKGERDFFGALVLGVYLKDELAFAGSVGTGFDRKLMESIHGLLEARAGARCPFAAAPELPQPVEWVRPELVCTVRFHSWTEDGRLRAPVFVGLRPEADPRECVREERLDAKAGVGTSPLLAGVGGEASVTVDGRLLRLRNLNKVFYPREGYTKRDIINYYDAVAELLAPHLKDRPLSLKRYPNGIGEAHFFQKNAVLGFPEWVRRERIAEDSGEPKLYVIGSDRAALVYLANLGCIDQNPWMSRVGSLDHPDFALIDLDPQECGFDRIVEAAQLVRRKLEQLGLEGYAKTTGGNGMHIYVPLEPVYTYGQTRSFAEILARLAAVERPDLFTMPRAVARREKGKVYFDYLQNGKGKTISAPYVLRAHPGAPVATPLAWREVTAGLRPEQFHIRNAPERFARLGDLFAGVITGRQRLEPAMERLEGLLRG